MPALKIIEQDGNWVAIAVNEEAKFLFKGRDLDNQHDMVHILANYMKNGDRNEIVNCFVDSDDITVDQIFGNCDILYYKETIAYGVTATETLLDDLEGAGEGLERLLLAEA